MADFCTVCGASRETLKPKAACRSCGYPPRGLIKPPVCGQCGRIGMPLEKGVNGGLAFLLLLLFIIPGIIYIVASGRTRSACRFCGSESLVPLDSPRGRQLAQPVAPARKCPFCAEQIRADAVVCKHCGRDLPADAPAGSPPPSAPA